MVQHDGGRDQVGVHHKRLQVEDQTNLTLEETNERSHLKDDATFTLLIVISPHMVVMFSEIDNIFG